MPKRQLSIKYKGHLGITKPIIFIKTDRKNSPIYHDAKKVTNSLRGIASKLGHALHITKAKDLETARQYETAPTSASTKSAKEDTPAAAMQKPAA